MRDVFTRYLRVTALLLATSVVSLTGFAQGTQAPAGGSPTVRRLSIDEAVKLALEQNLNLQVQRLDPQVQDLNVEQARTAWTPTLSSTFSNSSRTSPASSFLSGAQGGKLTNDNFNATVSATERLPWGASVDLSWDSTRSKSNNFFSSLNPALQSQFNATYTQPLLRNFKIDSSRQQLLVSRKNREISDVQLKQTVLSTVRSVKSAYWDLAYAVASLNVQRQSLDLARESLKNNRSRVSIGTMAPIDIVEAESEVAAREESVIVAEAAVTRAEDNLRALVFDPSTPGFWTMSLELTDQPTFQAQTIDVDAAIRKALEGRTDLTQARKTLESSDINIRYMRNQILPDVNIQAGYGTTGQGGTLLDCQGGFSLSGCPPGQLISTNTSYGSTLEKMLSRDFPNWSLSVNVSYPIGKSSAEANLARARIQYNQSQIQLRSMELQVTTQVREIARQVNTNRKRVDATRASRELATRKLEAEQKKFAAGMSTSFMVFQAQRDLAQARNAELQAVLDYNRSLVDFETVQEAPVSGGGGSITVAGSGASMSGGSSSAGSGSSRSGGF
jgi:outer membrane protein TolC